MTLFVEAKTFGNFIVFPQVLCKQKIANFEREI